MDQEIVPVIPGVRHLVLAEGHVSDHGIKKAVRERGCLKSLNSDVVFLIKLSGDPAGYRVELHTVHAHV